MCEWCHAAEAEKLKKEAREMEKEMRSTRTPLVPHPDVCAVIEKTADYVSRHGEAFEKRAARETERLSFLQKDDRYRPYFDKVLAEKKGELQK